MNVLGLIPARGGSESIPKKNLAIFMGQPLIYHVIRAAKQSKLLSSIICSTDDSLIAEYCESLRIPVHRRAEEFSQGDRPIQEVIMHALDSLAFKPDAVALLQPTSPFVTELHIDSCIAALKFNPHSNSVQTIAEFPHNHHAYNQRIIDGPYTTWAFPEERKKAFNKQSKPNHFCFGNVVVTRTSALHLGVFAEPSIGLLIDREYALDIDGPEDLKGLR